MGKHEVKVQITIGMTDEDILDLLVTAIEGGIGYWACLDNSGERWMTAPDDQSWAEIATSILLEGGGVTFLDDEDRCTSWVLTLKKLLEGVKMWVEQEDGRTCIDGEGIDMCMVDADAADSIIQLALFGELVFGSGGKDGHENRAPRGVYLPGQLLRIRVLPFLEGRVDSEKSGDRGA